ncbi:hypothetical protein NUH86_18115 [Sphingobium sp. JS3065]|uniref:hypothetical protein n=1 Tax=Sphingobium sp. JS3065 TaxID=2970925 RepID=UPI002264F2F6|nr:hypothetical protein [Sphingobium sp. JS3065]UZW57497.1 hypothetical protein NUH86_18115 [Sphingobium sp. JS3065]
MTLAGAASPLLEGRGEVSLEAGDHLLIPFGVAHLATYTAVPTIWLAVHIGED